jgi:hypothetical protein
MAGAIVGLSRKALKNQHNSRILRRKTREIHAFRVNFTRQEKYGGITSDWDGSESLELTEDTPRQSPNCGSAAFRLQKCPHGVRARKNE